MSSIGNGLVLSIAHWPLNSCLLSELIERSSSTTLQLLNEFESINHGHSVYEGNQTVHVNLTGSNCILTPGRLLQDWQSNWSEGEWVFSRLVGRIGMEHFQRSPKPGEIRLAGRLVDLNQSDFEKCITQQEKILKELAWIADHVRRNFVLNSSQPMKKAVILCPFDEGELEFGKDEFMETIRDVFKSEWSEKAGPLYGVEPEVELVVLSDSDSESSFKKRCIRN